MKKTGEYQKNDKGIIFKEISTISSNEGYLGYTDINDEINFSYKKDFSIKFDIEVYKLKKSGEIQKIVINSSSEKSRILIKRQKDACIQLVTFLKPPQQTYQPNQQSFSHTHLAFLV